MTDVIEVRSYTRRKPEKKPDPLSDMIEARKALLSKRYAPTPKPSAPSRLRRTLFWLSRIWRAV